MLKQGKTIEYQQLDALIAKSISEEGRKKASMFGKYCGRSQSDMLSEMWKLKKKLFPKKPSTLPSAIINHRCKIVTEPLELTKLIGEEYGRVRLRKRPTHPLNISGKQIRKKVLSLKLKIASLNKSLPFEMKDLEVVLKGLKTKKGRDPEGLSRTIFKDSVIGSN